MDKALKHSRGFLPADAQAAVVLQPSYGALNGPTALVSAQPAAILGLVLWFASGSVRRDEFDAAVAQRGVEFVRIIGFIADEPLRVVHRQHEVKEWLHQRALVGAGAAGIHGDGQAPGIHHDHEFDTLACLGATDAVAAAFGLGEAAVNVAFVEFEATTLLDQCAEGIEQCFKGAVANPALETPMHCALGAEFGGQILPLRAVVQNPEDAANGPAFVSAWPSAFGPGWMVGEQGAEYVELFLS